jgi:hypothetical protein
MMRYRSYVLSSLVAGLLAIVPACGDDDDGDGHEEAELEGDCKEISEACHDVDEGEGEILACHELAHENDTAACSAQLESCTELCGGGHGH